MHSFYSRLFGNISSCQLNVQFADDKTILAGKKWKTILFDVFSDTPNKGCFYLGVLFTLFIKNTFLVKNSNDGVSIRVAADSEVAVVVNALPFFIKYNTL